MRRALPSVLAGLALLAGGWACGQDGGLDKLLAELRRGEPGAKQRVIDASVPAVKPLCAMLTDKDARVAWEARSALRWIAVHAAESTAPAGRRGQVRDAALPLVKAGEPVVRRVAVEMLGFVGADLDVPLLAGLLGDEALAETAAVALCEIWGHAGKGAMIDALTTAKPGLKARVLDLIASHREADTLPLFVEAARDADEGVRVAAVKAIGLLADPKGALTLVEAVQQGSARVRSAAFDSHLAVAATRLQAGDLPAARGLYEQALGLAATDEQRAGALVGIGRVGDPASLPKTTAALKAPSPQVRRAAYAALCQVRGPAGTQAIAAALPGAPDGLKPLLIATLGARRDRSTATQLLGLTRSPIEPVALAAVRALGETGDPAAANPLLAVAEGAAPDAVKAAALRAALAFGHVLADRGQGAPALAIFQRAFRLAPADADRAEALHGMGKVGDPRALDTIGPILADEKSTLRDAAFEACLGIADAASARGDRDNAVAVLKKIADLEPSGRIAQEATKKLHALGVHVNLAARDGAIASWWIIGPFDCPKFDAAKKPQFPEREIDLKKVYKVAGRTLRWKLHHSSHAKGWVDLNAQVKPNDKVLAYCYTELAVEREQEVELHLGRDDGLTVWLNGKVLYDEHGPHGAAAEEFVVKGTLAKGVNKLLVKSSEGGGAWEFYVRITDTKGKPLDNTKK